MKSHTANSRYNKKQDYHNHPEKIKRILKIKKTHHTTSAAISQSSPGFTENGGEDKQLTIQCLEAL